MADGAMNSFEDRQVVLVTAGAAGIGRVMAESFLASGYKVHVCDLDPAAIDTFLQANPGGTASLADISDVPSVDQLFVDFRNRHGRLDVLVNNAGIAGPTAPVEDIEPEDWDRTIAVNLSGQFYCTRKAVPMLKESGGGVIINIASSAAFHGCPNRLPYTASKWALIGFTRTLAMELGPFGIRVNAICPGSVSGERIDGVIERDAGRQGVSPAEIRQRYTRQTSLGCFVEPEDVAGLALFLVSEAGARISGQAIGVDGHTETLSNLIG